MADGIHTLAYEHTNLNNFNEKMSYNEIPNLLVDSVVLPNKPLSNLEIIDVAKKYHCMDLEEYFCETLFVTNKIKRMWYFKFRLIFWRWYTLGNVVQER